MRDRPYVPPGASLKLDSKDTALVWVPWRQQPYTVWCKGPAGWYVKEFYA